jgi:multiple sugar transport system substrate-binding protein
MNNFYWQQFIDEGVLQNLLPAIQQLDTPGLDLDEYFPALIDATSREGKVYGLPRRIATSIFIVNLTLFEEVGVELPPASPEDWTWDEFSETAKAMTDPDAKRFGANINQAISWSSTFVYSNGGNLLDPETHSVAKGYLDSDENAEFVAWYKSMVVDGSIPGPGDLEAFGGGTGAMTGGNLAIIHSGTGFQVHIAKNEGAPYTWGMTKCPYPAGKELIPHIATHGSVVPVGVADVSLSTQLAGYTAWGPNTEMENPIAISTMTEYAKMQFEAGFDHFEPIFAQAMDENVRLHEGALTTHLSILFSEWNEMMDRVLLEDMAALESLQIAAQNFDDRVAEKEA